MTLLSVCCKKEWFVWDDDSKPLFAGTSLVFRIQWEVSFKDRTSYRDVSVSGDIFVPDQLKRLVKVGSVAFQQDNCKGNPVLAYLQCHGSPQGLSTPLANNDHSLTSPTGTVFNALLSNESYSRVSGDFNPIHVNPYFANYADLPGTITHRLWTSAATRRYIEMVVAQGHPERVLTYVYILSCQIIDLQVNHRYDVKFIGMVLPGDELTVTIKHVGT
jgi:fatty acid synthase subunit alpha